MIFNSKDQLYRCVGGTFERLQPAQFAPLHRAQLMIELICQQPDGQIVLNGRELPVGIYFDKRPPADPNLTIWLEALTLHHIMLGELGIMKAMGQNKIKAKGSLLRVRKLGALFEESQKIYPQVLAENGFGR